MRVTNPFTGQTINTFCPTGKGGGIKNTCGGGSGGSGGKDSGSGNGGGKKHSVSLPKNPKKLNIGPAEAALKEMGYKLGSSGYDPEMKATVYELETPEGQKKKLSARDIAKIVYAGAK